jgi:hypothetical protein
MATTRPGAALRNEFPTFDSDGQNADLDEGALPTMMMVRNGTDLPDVVFTVVRKALGRYRYSTVTPDDSVANDSIQIRATATVDGVEASDIVDEYTVVAAACSNDASSCETETYDPAACDDLDDLAVIRPQTATNSASWR